MAVDNEKIVEYCDLIDYCRFNQLWDLFDIASNHTLFFSRLLDSRRNRSLR